MNRTLSTLFLFAVFAGFSSAATDQRRAFLDAFAAAKAGQELSTIPLPAGWPDRALIQAVPVHTTIKQVWRFEGATVFRIYPDYETGKGQKASRAYYAVLKVDSAGVSVEELTAAFLNQPGHKGLRVLEYALFEPPGKIFHREPPK